MFLEMVPQQFLLVATIKICRQYFADICRQQICIQDAHILMSLSGIYQCYQWENTKAIEAMRPSSWEVCGFFDSWKVEVQWRFHRGKSSFSIRICLPNCKKQIPQWARKKPPETWIVIWLFTCGYVPVLCGLTSAFQAVIFQANWASTQVELLNLWAY